MLTDKELKAAKPREKPYKLSDGLGLYVEVKPNGSKLWRLKYRYEGKEKRLSFGGYPDTSGTMAREKRDEARKLLASGVDPSAARQAEKVAGADSFEAIALEWFAKFSPKWALSNSDKIKRQLERDLFPWLGNKPINKITPPILLACLRRIENRGAVDSAHRAHQLCGRVFRYAVATGRAERDASADLRGAIPPAIATNHPAITTPVEAGGLMRAIDDYKGSFVVRCALQLVALTATRSGELRGAQWTEFDTEAGVWTIPASRMKSRAEHKVFLSRQAIEILEELRPLTGRSVYVFPCVRSSQQTLSNNSLNAALRRMGFTKHEMTTHGFRSMFSSMANEHGFDADVIERSLAHVEQNAIRAAYHRSQYIEDRKKLAQWWADHLDSLRAGAKVIPFKRGV